MTQIELRTLGDSTVVEFAKNNEMTEQEARTITPTVIAVEFKDLKNSGIIPADMDIKAFRDGWRRDAPYQHGKYIKYANGCRCKACKDAWNTYRRTLYKRKKQKMIAGSVTQGVKQHLSLPEQSNLSKCAAKLLLGLHNAATELRNLGRDVQVYERLIEDASK